MSVVLAAALVISLSGCGDGNKPTTTTAAKDAGTTAAQTVPVGESGVLYSNGGPEEFFETPWLNPGSFTYNKVIYDRLIVADENLAPLEGQLASTYKLSDDGTILEMELRDNIFWHDGEAITVDDVKWSIEYSMKTPVLNAVFVGTFKAIEGSQDYLDGKADEVKGIVVDGNKITITFDQVAPDALLTFTQFAPLPKKYFADVDPLNVQQAKFFQNPIGSGPFKVKEVKMKDYTLLEGFDKYWNGTPTYTMHLNPSAGDSDMNFVNNAKAGKLDYAYTKNIADVKGLDGVAGINIEQVDVRYTRLLYPNKFNKKDGKASPLADAKVRQAIRYAIDMEQVCESIFEGAAIPANSLTPNGASKAEGLDEYKFDQEKAKQLLKEANWDPNYELDVVYYYTDQQTVDLMTIIQSYLQQVGMKMKFRLVEGDLATLLWKAPADAQAGPSAVDWDMCYAAISALSMHEYYDRFAAGNALNSHTPADAKLTELIAATNSSVDQEVQDKAFKELQKFENETLFNIPLYYQPVFIVRSDKLAKSFDNLGNPQFNYNWDVQNWEVK